ncbi:MAG: acyl-CoA thioesterase [Bryobacteraceae bacterium]
MPRAYEYLHIAGFEDTNLVGNVYYVNHLRWQGRCREMFLREHVPELLHELQSDLALVTLFCSCEYLDEIVAFDEILVRMTLAALTQSRMTLHFEYWRGGQLVARGEQRIACMRRQQGKMAPTPVPERLREALRNFEA